MSKCIKELYDYDLVKRCCRCKLVCSKSNFYKNVNRKDGANSLCITCMNKYNRENMKKGIKTDVSFRFIRNTRRRYHHALNGKLKSTSTLDILGIDIETYRKRIEFQLNPEMNWSNIEIDLVKAIVCLMYLKMKNKKRHSPGKILKPYSSMINTLKEHNFLDYQLHFIKAYQFPKLNENGPN